MLLAYGGFLKQRSKDIEEVERFYARPFAKGFNQMKGMDFDKTYNPEIKQLQSRQFSPQLNNLMPKMYFSMAIFEK